MLIISGQNLESLRNWTSKSPKGYLYASDEEAVVIQKYKLKIPMLMMSRPATILIDKDKMIRMRFTGVRTDSSRDDMKENVCELPQNKII